MIVTTNIAQMFAALSATNEAILRATSEDELFQRVCDAAVFGGELLGTGVLLTDHEHRLRFVAGAGAGLDTLREMTSSTDEHSADGQGLAVKEAKRGVGGGDLRCPVDLDAVSNKPVASLRDCRNPLDLAGHSSSMFP